MEKRAHMTSLSCLGLENKQLNAVAETKTVFQLSNMSLVMEESFINLQVNLCIFVVTRGGKRFGRS